MPTNAPTLTLRLATPADRAAIVDLLRISLGDGSTEKSAAFWRWKHVDNPFGPSPVMVADDGGRIVGVRAFMRWTWQDGTRSYRALRAVDTATHPDYRGQGIFKRLTLDLIDRCQADGDDFIFNTPNEQSRPGYLKMGWRELGKVPLRVAPLRPLRMATNLALKKDVRPLELPATPFDALGATDRLHWLKELGADGEWRTPPTAAFLKWRYADCPARQYFLSGDPDRYLIFYYGREQAVGTELRLVHYLVRPGHETAARRAVGELRRRFKPAVMTAAPGAALPAYFLPPQKLGLILTFRALNVENPPSLERWRYSLGDLELF